MPWIRSRRRALPATAVFCLLAATPSLPGPSAPLPPVPPAERLVGIAYSTWFDAKHWNNTWGTPLLGRYDSRDRAIIRRHAAWLHDAGVDFVWLDWSNQINYDPAKEWKGGRQDLIEEATAILFDEYAQLEHTPKISIFLGVTDKNREAQVRALTDGRLQKKADQVYNMYVANPRYRPLLQNHLGKPLLVVYTNTPCPWQKGLPEWNDDRFTVRWMTGFVTEQKSLLANNGSRVSKFGYWSWEDRGPQTYAVHDGNPEAMVVCAATRQAGHEGTPNHIPAEGRRNGDTFRQQWARAREIGPRFAMVVSWNEWVRGEQPSPEVSKDIEPSKEFGDFYLKLLKEEIARFKGHP